MIRKILVQLDPRRPQRKARILAAMLAQRFRAELLALYVVDERVLTGGETIHAVQDALTAIGEQTLSDYAHEVPQDIRLDKFIGYGDTAQVVENYVRTQGADLVVTGGLHAAAYKQVPFGSIVADVIAKTHVSVLVVRDWHPTPHDGAPIVQAFGPERGSAKALYATVPFSKAYKSRIVATTVGKRRKRDVYETQLMGAKAHESKLEVPVDVAFLTRKPLIPAWRTLKAAAARLEANFLVVPRSFELPGRMGSTSPIENLATHTRVPLLVH